MTKIVITQPMFFPWVGLLEQIKLADILVFYNDVQFSKGSFTNRVQTKTKNGKKWLTVPLYNHKLGQKINEVKIQPKALWYNKIINLLIDSFNNAPFRDDAINLAAKVLSGDYKNLAEISISSISNLLEYFQFPKKRILFSEKIGINGSGSDRVLEIVKQLKGEIYISGLGGKNYLNHEKFENNGVKVFYMKYEKKKYLQQFGDFDPYVSSLDLIANYGKNSKNFLVSNAKHWKNSLL